MEASRILAIPSEILIIKKRNWVTKLKSPLYIASPERRSSSEVEQRIRNARVAGSIPAFGSTFSLNLNEVKEQFQRSVEEAPYRAVHTRLNLPQFRTVVP